MNRLFILLVSITALCSVRAQGPDEQYVRIYQLIQEADRLGETGQGRAAAAKYVEAQDALIRFRGIYPGWNDRLVNYRLGYITTRLAPLSASLAGSTPIVVPATNVASTEATNLLRPTPPVVSVASVPAELENQVKTLQAEIERLQADNRLLGAKLKEALSVQPAAVDPRELAKAEDRIRALQKENELFKVQLAQKPNSISGAGANDLSAKLSEQNEVINTLRTENEVLKRQATEWRQKHDALAAAGNVRNETGPRSASIESETPRMSAENLALRKEVELLRQVSLRNPAPQAVPVVNSAVPAEMEHELAALRARVDVLQAKPVPYTREELALLDKGTPSLAANVTTVPANAAQRGNFPPPAEGSPRNLTRGIPIGAGALMRAAEMAFRGARFADAEQKYLEVLRQDPDNVTVLGDLASAQVELGHVADAEKNVQHALELAPDDSFNLYLLGRIRFSQEKMDEALDALSRSAKSDPNAAETQNYLGIVLSEKGLRGAAEVALRKAIQLQPDYAVAHHNLAFIYATQKPPALALARWHYKKARDGGHPPNAGLEKLLH